MICGLLDICRLFVRLFVELFDIICWIICRLFVIICLFQFIYWLFVSYLRLFAGYLRVYFWVIWHYLRIICGLFVGYLWLFADYLRYYSLVIWDYLRIICKLFCWLFEIICGLFVRLFVGYSWLFADYLQITCWLTENICGLFVRLFVGYLRLFAGYLSDYFRVIWAFSWIDLPRLRAFIQKQTSLATRGTKLRGAPRCSLAWLISPHHPQPPPLSGPCSNQVRATWILVETQSSGTSSSRRARHRDSPFKDLLFRFVAGVALNTSKILTRPL